MENFLLTWHELNIPDYSIDGPASESEVEPRSTATRHVVQQTKARMTKKLALVITYTSLYGCRLLLK